MQKNKDISDSQHSSSAGGRTQTDCSTKTPFSNSVSQLRQTKNKRKKKKVLKPWEISGKQSETVLQKGFSDRTKIHFTSRYYKNINLIQLKANIGAWQEYKCVTLNKRRCLKWIMQAEIQYIKSNPIQSKLRFLVWLEHLKQCDCSEQIKFAADYLSSLFGKQVTWQSILALQNTWPKATVFACTQGALC